MMNNWEQKLYKNVGLCKISRVIPRIPDLSGNTQKRLLDSLLPTFHYVISLSLLDGAFDDYIEDKPISWPKDRNRDLYNKIEIVSLSVPFLDKNTLHAMRKRRNEIAHDLGQVFSRPVSWLELDEAISAISLSMEQMGLITTLPDIEPFYSRVPTHYDDLGPDGERIRFEYTVGAKMGVDIILEFKNTVLCMPLQNTVS